MKWCSCGHSRLMHDSWGCKEKDGCSVSIIYLTEQLRSEEPSPADATEVIERGNQLVVEADRLEESHVRIMHERALQLEQEIIPPYINLGLV